MSKTLFAEKCLKCGKLYVLGKTPLICKRCGTHTTLANTNVVEVKRTILGLKEVKTG